MADEETLDPDDWDAFRATAHGALDRAIGWLRGARDRPGSRPVPEHVRRVLDEDAPIDPQPLDAVCETFMRAIVPYGTGSAALVEARVVRWLIELLGLSPRAGGVLVGGAATANLIGVATARNARAAPGPSIVYASAETGGWLDPACDLLGLGGSAITRVACDADRRLDARALDRAIEADRATGRTPLCVVGTIGAAATGACDDLVELAAVCRAHGAWLHVDGGVGARARLSPQLEHVARGLERANSIAVDLHRWGYLPDEVACALVRDPAAHADAFARATGCLAPRARGLRAVEVWMALKTHGAAKLGRVIAQHAAQARYLAERLGHEPRFELAAPVALDVVCFRVRGADDRRHQDVLARAHEAGQTLLSSTRLDGRLALRVAITSHRTRRAELDQLVELVRAIAAGS